MFRQLWVIIDHYEIVVKSQLVNKNIALPRSSCKTLTLKFLQNSNSGYAIDFQKIHFARQRRCFDSIEAIITNRSSHLFCFESTMNPDSFIRILKLTIIVRIPVFVLFVIACLQGCAENQPQQFPHSAPLLPEKNLQIMGYTIQVGAFSKVENAARLSEILADRGLNATYFKAEDGFFKVRFGNFSVKSQAMAEAERFKSSGIISDYYIVNPGEYAISRRESFGDAYLREELVKTSRRFIDIPYLWGGRSADTGFDCSGLTMTVYQLNGMNLPRTSRQQFETGLSVRRDSLLKGDLVFFSNNKRGNVSHVGIFIGDGQFIHAPGKGKTIRTDSLSSRHYDQRYMGGRTYLMNS